MSFAADKPQDLAVFGQSTKMDSGLVSTYGYLSFFPPPEGSKYKRDISGEMIGFLPEQFKTQPWREVFS